MAKSGEWYRNSRWSPKVEKNFFERIARCRTMLDKAQNARIKACHLEESGDTVRIRAAIGLLKRIRKEWRLDSENATCLWQLGNCHLGLGDLDGAIAHFRRCLKAEEEIPGVQTGALTDFARMVAERRLRHLYGTVLRKFKKREDYSDTAFPFETFVTRATRSVIAHDRGRLAEAHREAEAALEQAGRRRSGMANHPKLGLVRGEKKLKAFLIQIANDPAARSARERSVEPGHLPRRPPKDEVGALEWKLLVQLSELDVKVKNAWELTQAAYDPDLVVPLLLRFRESLPRKKAFRELRDHVLQLLLERPGREKRHVADLFVEEHRRPGARLDWSMAIEYARIARREHAPFILETIRDSRHGHDREPLLRFLKKFWPDRAQKVLLRLLDEPEGQRVGPLWVMEELRLCGDASCIPRIEPFLTAEHASWRKKARMTIDQILERKGR